MQVQNRVTPQPNQAVIPQAQPIIPNRLMTTQLPVPVAHTVPGLLQQLQQAMSSVFTDRKVLNWPTELKADRGHSTVLLRRKARVS